jgi:peptidyl-prolyl cis-trans isomerase SurA
MRRNTPNHRVLVARCQIVFWLLGTSILNGAAELCAAQTAPQAQIPQAPDSRNSAPVVLDRVVAVVNNRPILWSDVEDEIRLSVLDTGARQSEVTPQRALELLIRRTLIEQQIRQEDLRALTPTQDEINARLEEIRRQLPACIRQDCASDKGWKTFLAAHDLTEESVENYFRHRLEILRFIEQRFRQGIQISQEQIEDYYRNTLLPQYAAGEAVPPMDKVAPRIQEILLQQQVNVLFGSWLSNLREQGDVEVLDPALAPALDGATNPGGAGRGDP